MIGQCQPGSAALRQTLDAIAPAIENLARHQEQCDMDGVMVKVSRQTLDEVLNAVNNIAIDLSGDVAVAAREWPPKLTGEIACILEDCDPPENQTPEAVTALIAGYQRTWDRILAALPSEAIGREWRSFDSAPRDGTKITAWHQMWKCPVSVSYIAGRRSQCKWVEATITTEWPDEAFTHWQPLLAGPVVTRPDRESL